MDKLKKELSQIQSKISYIVIDLMKAYEYQDEIKNNIKEKQNRKSYLTRTIRVNKENKYK